VWGLLADPFSYPYWVAGTKRVVATTGGWPAPGARLFHRWGLRPFVIADHSTVTRCDPGRRLELTAFVRPLAVVDVRIELSARAGGTDVALTESIVSGRALAVPWLARLIQDRRNARGLRLLLARASERQDDR